MGYSYIEKTYRSPDCKDRLCLKCKRSFPSDGKGNRICRKCKGNWLGDNMSFRVDLESGVIPKAQMRKSTKD